MDGLAANGLRYANFHTTALCSPTRSCLLTGRNHHSNGMGRITDLATGFPGYDARIPRANGFLSEMLVEQGYAAWAVGKWHLVPEEETHLAAPRGALAARPRLRALLRVPRRRDPPVRAVARARQPLRRPAPVDRRRLPPHRGSRRPRDRRRLRPACGRSGQAASSSTSPPARATPRTRRRRSGSSATAAASTAAGTSRASEILERQKAMGLLPEQTELSPRPEWVPAWDSLCDRRAAGCTRATWRRSPGSSRTPTHQLGRLARRARGDRRPRQHDRDARVRQRRVVGGWRDRIGERRAAVEPGRAGPSTRRRAHRRDRRTAPPQQLPVGLDRRRQHARSKRWKREVHEGGVADPLIVHWPNAASRRGARSGTSTSTRSTSLPSVLDVLGVDAPDDDRRARADADRGRELRAELRRARRAERRAPRSTSRCSDAARSTTTAGRRSRTTRSTWPNPGLDRVDWELYHVADDPSECHDLAADGAGAARGHDRPVVGGGRAPPGAPDRQPAVLRVHAAASEARRGVGDARHLPPGRRDGPRGVGHQPARPVAHDHRRRRGARGRRRRRAARAREPHGRVHASSCRTAGSPTCTTSSGGRGRGSTPTSPVRVRARTGSPSGSRAPTPTAGRSTLLVDGDEVGRGEIARFTPIRWNLTGAGLRCGADPGLAVCDDYTAPFPYRRHVAPRRRRGGGRPGG